MSRILIAQPDRAVRALLHAVVGSGGHEPLSYEPLLQLERGVDAVVLDPAWPDGLACAQRLRAERPELPIVCASVYRPTAAAVALDAICYLVLPAPLAEIDEAIRSAFAHV